MERSCLAKPRSFAGPTNISSASDFAGREVWPYALVTVRSSIVETGFCFRDDVGIEMGAVTDVKAMRGS